MLIKGSKEKCHLHNITTQEQDSTQMCRNTTLSASCSGFTPWGLDIIISHTYHTGSVT